MPSSNVVRGNLAFSALIAPTLSPISVAANTVAEQTFTVQGLMIGDFISVTKPTTQAGLGIVNARVSAANTLAVAFNNATAATITPTASEIYTITVDRPESTPLPANLS